MGSIDMAIRNAFTIADEIKNKLKDDATSKDDIAELFKEAYSLLPEGEELRKQALAKLNSILANATSKKNKDLLSDEEKQELRTLRDNGGVADVKQEETSELKLGEVDKELEVEGNNIDIEVPVEETEAKPTQVQEEKEDEVVVNNVVFNPMGEIVNEDEAEPTQEQEEKEDVVLPLEVDENQEETEEQNEEVVTPLFDFENQDEEEPEVYIADCTLEELDEIIGTKPDMAKMSFIEDKKSKKILKQSLESNKPEIALANVDDLVMSYKYFVDDNLKKSKADGDKAEVEADKARDILDAVTKGQLEGVLLDSSVITPNNILAFRALLDRCPDVDLKDKVIQVLASRMVEFDKENFGGKTSEELNENYTKIHKDAKNINPFALPYNENEDGDLDLSKLSFSDAEGKLVSLEKDREQKLAIAELARELAAQRMAKKDSYTKEELEAEIKKITKEIISEATVNGGVKKGENGGYIIPSDNVANTLGVKFKLEAESFKNRVGQKFKGTAFYKNVSKRVENIDKKLEKRFGKAYVTGKKVAGFIGKIAWSTAKTTAMYSVAGLVPGGVPALMAYNLYKNIKNARKQAEGASFAKKGAIFASTALTSVITLAGISGGLAEGANNLIMSGNAGGLSDTFSGISKSIHGVLGKGAELVGCEGIYSSITNLQGVARVGVLAGASMSINAVDLCYQGLTHRELKKEIKHAQKGSDENIKSLEDRIAGIRSEYATKGFFKRIALRLSERRLKKELNEAKQIKDSGGFDKIKDLEKKLSENNENIRANICDMVGKGAGSFIGMGMAQALAPTFNEAAQNMAETAKDYVSEINANLDKYDWEKGLPKFGFAGLGIDGQERDIKVPFRPEYNPDGRGMPDDVSYRTETSHNLEGVKGSLTDLGDARIKDIDSFAKGIADHTGSKAELATMACKMSPYALQEVLKLDLPEGSNPTTYNMLNYLSGHDLTPEQTGALNKFIDNNFEGSRFRTENFDDWKSAPTTGQTATTNRYAGENLQETVNNITKEAILKSGMPQNDLSQVVNGGAGTDGGAKPEEGWRKVDVKDTGNKAVDALNDKYATTNDKGSGFKFEPVNNGTEQTQAQTQQPKVIVVEQQPQQGVIIQEPVHGVIPEMRPANVPSFVWNNMSPESRAYVVEHGLIYDPIASRGIDRVGDPRNPCDGYAGIFTDPDPYARDSERAHIVPNDMMRQGHLCKSTLYSNVLGMQEGKEDVFFNNYGCRPDPYAHASILSSSYGGYAIHNDELYNGIYKAGAFIQNATHMVGDVVQFAKIIGSSMNKC